MNSEELKNFCFVASKYTDLSEEKLSELLTETFRMRFEEEKKFVYLTNLHLIAKEYADIVLFPSLTLKNSVSFGVYNSRTGNVTIYNSVNMLDMTFVPKDWKSLYYNFVMALHLIVGDDDELYNRLDIEKYAMRYRRLSLQAGNVPIDRRKLMPKEIVDEILSEKALEKYM